MRAPRLTMVTSGLGTGGSELQLTQLACGLQDRGWRVHVVCMQADGPYAETLSAHGIPVAHSLARRLASPRQGWHLARHVRCSRPDIVHTQAFRANLWGRLAAILQGLPTVASVRSTYNYLPRPYFVVERRLARWTAAVITPSRATSQHLITEVGLAPHKVLTIPNGVDTNLFHPNVPGHRLREAWGLTDEFTVLCPARLVPEKNHEHLLATFRAFTQTQPNSVLVLAGAGPLEQDLRQTVQRLGIDTRFVGALSRGAMSEAMAAADVVCLLSLREGMPNALLEAMAAGRPVVASAADGSAELVEHGVSGFLVAPTDIANTVEAFTLLARAPQLARRLGSAGRKKVLSEYSIDANVARHAELYKGVLSHGEAVVSAA